MNGGNMTLWILIADESRARVFSRSAKGAALHEVEGFVHPKGRMRDADLVTDRPGRVRTGLRGESVTTMSPHNDPKTVEAGRFAAELARSLRTALDKSEFDLLALVAPPKFLGLLRGELDEGLRRRVVASSTKDLILTRTDQLPAHLFEVLGQAGQAELALQHGA
jgi:protein required for attachment to host cells